jgi:diaminopimelate epimerase
MRHLSRKRPAFLLYLINMQFTKMHGLGNDFILIDSRKNKLDGVDLKNLALRLCDRHFGIGADGILIVWPSQKAHYRMQVINPDGSEAEMCGNGIRCFAKYVYEADKLKEEVISVETLAGIKLPAVILSPSGGVEGVEVDMGQPKEIQTSNLKIQNNEYKTKEISMGNPHAVIFAEDLSVINLAEIGPQIENHPHFPNRTNVEFVKVLNEKEIDVIVWERGAGETLACGTGACAAVAAAVKAGKTSQRVLVHLPGGNLDIEIGDDGRVLMRGPAEKVFEGEINI